MKVTLTQADALKVSWEAKQFLMQPPDQGGTGLLPDGVSDWLASLRLPMIVEDVQGAFEIGTAQVLLGLAHLGQVDQMPHRLEPVLGL